VSLEHIRLSSKARDQLIWLKRWTGIENWNVLCRWGFCLSLAEPSTPPPARVPADSTVEMSWRTFAGTHSDLYAELLRVRVKKDGLPLDEDTVSQQFRLHLHRGIAYLAGDRKLRSIGKLVRKVNDGRPTPIEADDPTAENSNPTD
jgi:DNA sulfur modification protein DndE